MWCSLRRIKIRPTSLHSSILTLPLRFVVTLASSPKSYTVTPPIKRWPKHLPHKRLVTMIIRIQNVDLALQIFHHAGKFHPGFAHNYHTYYAMIYRLSRFREFEAIESLLVDLRKSGIRCGEELFVEVIRSYGFAGKPKMALKTFLRIPAFGVRRSAKSLNASLNALVDNKQFSLVHLLFKHSHSRFGVLPNVNTFNILIKGLCANDDVEGARKVLDEMPATRVIPNVVTYTTILSAYALRGDMVGAMRVFGVLLDHRWRPDATTFTILMDGYVKQGRLTDALKVMDEMEQHRVRPNEITYGVIIGGYCREKKAGEARNLLNEMLKRKYIPYPSLCCKVIDVLCSEGEVKEACALWKKLLKHNCPPDNATISSLIHWLCKEGDVWEARKLFNEFESDSISSVLTYNTLIAGMCEMGELCEAARLWDDMLEKGCAPNQFTYNMLIKGFLKVGNAKEAIKVVKEMLDKQLSPNESTYLILAEGLIKLGKGEEFLNVLSMFISSGITDFNAWHVFVPKFVCNMDEQANILDKILNEIFS